MDIRKQTRLSRWPHACNFQTLEKENRDPIEKHYANQHRKDGCPAKGRDNNIDEET